MDIGIGEGKDFSLSKKLEIYDDVGVSIIPDDDKYIIYYLDGRIMCENKMDECFAIKKKLYLN